MDALKFLNVANDLVTAEKIIVRLPITDNIKQPYGIVHGDTSHLNIEYNQSSF